MALRAVWGGVMRHATGYHMVRLLIGFGPGIPGFAKRELQWLKGVGR
jgi:hypothetical protein